MTAPRTETSSLEPSEDKSLIPAEDKTAATAAVEAPADVTEPQGTVAVVLVHHYNGMLPGAKIDVPARLAATLVDATYATYA